MNLLISVFSCISISLFTRFTDLNGNLSCILNSMRINLYIPCHKKVFFFFFFLLLLLFLLGILFCTLLTFSHGVTKFGDVTSSTLVKQRDSVLTGIYFFQEQQKLQICIGLEKRPIYRSLT